MQAISPTLTKRLSEDAAIGVKTRVIAEFNHNSMDALSMYPVANVAGVEEHDEEMCPLSSITASNRPTAGIVYAREPDLLSTPAGSMAINEIDFDGVGPRFLVSSVDAKYKYWISPTDSNGTGTITNVTPTVRYDTARNTNKIYVCFENTIVQPTNYTIAVSVNGTTYNTVASNIAPSARGIVELWLQDNGTWSTTKNLNNSIDLKGLKVTVTKVNLAGQRVSLIEQGLRLETDLSDFVKNWSCDSGMSDSSQITPLGKSSGGGGDVVLSNVNMLFNNQSATSPYKTMLDQGVIFKIDSGYNIGTWMTPVWEYVRAATLRSVTWRGQDRSTTDVKLQDDSALLQTLNPPATLIEGSTVGAIVGMLLDSVGYNNYSIDQNATDTSVVIPYYSTDGEKNVWELMSDMSQATQTSFFFDEWGVLRVRSLTAAYNANRTVPVYLRGANSGSNLANIQNFKFSGDHEANLIKVNYSNTVEAPTSPSGYQQSEVVWQPQDDVVLRSTFLQAQLTSSAMTMYMGSTNTWPYAAITQIEGEFIRYDAKLYGWYDKLNAVHYDWVEDEAQQKAFDVQSNGDPRYVNRWTGTVRIKERGAFGTIPKTHYVETNGYGKLVTNNGGSKNVYAWNAGVVKTPGMSWVDLRTNSTFRSYSIYRMQSGDDNALIPTRIGTKFRINSMTGSGGAGISLSRYSGEGYYIEIMPTDTIDSNNLRNITHELRFYSCDGSRNFKKVHGVGVPMGIAKGIWYDMDIIATYNTGGTANFVVYINGVLRGSWTISNADRTNLDSTGRFGPFVRGNGSASFEYLYAQSGTVLELSDGDRVWDRISGGYTTDQSLNEWMGSIKTLYRIVNKKKQYYTQRYTTEFVDDFAAVVHEAREFDVKYEKGPAQFSRLLFTNDTGIVCPWFEADSHSARFMLINTSRNDSIVNGEDTLLYGIDSPITQQLGVYGRVLKIDEPETYEVKNAAAIRRRGEKPVEISSTLIQTKAAAKVIGDFIVNKWADSNDEVDSDIFGVPHLQIGDVVTVDHPQLNISAAKYYVTGISNSYSSGPSFSVKLRKVKI